MAREQDDVPRAPGPAPRIGHGAQRPRCRRRRPPRSAGPARRIPAAGCPATRRGTRRPRYRGPRSPPAATARAPRGSGSRRCASRRRRGAGRRGRGPAGPADVEDVCPGGRQERRVTERGRARRRGSAGTEVGGEEREGRGHDPGQPGAARARGRGGRGPGVAPLRDPGELAGEVVRALPALVAVLGQALRDHAVEGGRRQGLDAARPARGSDVRMAAIRLAWLFPRRRAAPSPSRRAPRRRRRCPPARPAPRPRSAPAPCTAACRRWCPRRSAAVLRGQRGERGSEGARWRGAASPARSRAAWPRLREHHVAGLQVPMDDALPVGAVEGLRDLDGVAQRLLEGQRALLRRSASVSPSRYSMTR